jgi:hypothetical protein
MIGADFELWVRASRDVAPGIWVTRAVIKGRRELFGRRAGAGVAMASSALRAAIEPERDLPSFIALLAAALGGSPAE